jgi:ribosomal protein S18 acetylase RimI-like enzyme
VQLHIFRCGGTAVVSGAPSPVIAGDHGLLRLRPAPHRLTRTESSEIFIYDIAVRVDKQRLGIGRRLIAALRDMAAAEGIHDLFVPADDEDTHALEFYRALGAAASPVTFFVFSRDGD